MSYFSKGKTAVKEKERVSYQLRIGDKAKVIMPDGSIKIFQVVWKEESNPLEGLISNESPVGKALLGAVAGEIRSYRVINNGKERIFQLKVLEVYSKKEKEER